LSDGLTIGPIARAEIEPAVSIFFEAFHDNVTRLYGDQPKPDAMVDVWSFAREVEPGAFLAARDGSDLLGYALFTSSVKTLERRALTSGRIFVWMWHALSGRYGIRWDGLTRQVWNKMLFVGSSSNFRTTGDAQLLNIAVAETARGRGVATELVRAGMEYLAGRGIREVRLEVLPDNEPAIAAYHAVGFQERGRMRNVHGEWLVMTATPRTR
jgi:[ribosomal protein S18]-alanine N-acetyltransferase